MKAGTYYIGDLCYVLHDRWEEFCELTIKGRECLDGVFHFADGTEFATYGTAYGDGTYKDQHGLEYGVDAGLIGCVLVDDIAESERENIGSGHVVTFDRDFNTWEDAGQINFGSAVSINTDYEEEEEDEDEDDDARDDE